MSLKDEIEAAEAKLARLKQQALTATCAEVGHRWKLMGGRNCGCIDGETGRSVGNCSVPVYECEVCKDCDYGENNEAERILADCRIGA